MALDRSKMIRGASVVARILQLGLCLAAIVAMAIKYFVITLVLVVACIGVAVAVSDSGFKDAMKTRQQFSLTSLVRKYSPYNKLQTVDAVLAVLLVVAAVAFLASDTIDAACDIVTKSTAEKVADAADSALNSIGLGGDDSSSGGSASSSGDGDSAGCTAVKTSVACALVAALAFLATIAFSCLPARREHGDQQQRSTDVDSGKPSGGEEADDAYIEVATPRAEGHHDGEQQQR